MLQQPAGQSARPLPPMGAGRAGIQGPSIASCMPESRQPDARDTAETDKTGYDVSNMERRATQPRDEPPMQQPEPTIPTAVYARVSSDRQDVDLSVGFQLRALRDYAKCNGYTEAREYTDEAESGRLADRPQFRTDHEPASIINCDYG